MNYTLHQLKVFLKVVENQSITKASEALFLTQPAVSIQLKKFQDQFSVPLTEVVGRKLYITDFGYEIAKAAENILNEVDAINYKTMLFNNQLAGRLKLSIVSTGKYVMPYFLSNFMHMNKGVDLVMDVTNKTQVIKTLELNEVDFALVSTLPAHLKLQRISLLMNKLYLVGSSQLPKNEKRIQTRLKKYPMIYREPGSATRAAMEQFIDENDLPSSKKIELTSNEAVKQAVVAGLGYSIMPLIGIRNEIKNGDLEIIPLKGLPIITQWNLVWLTDKKLSPVAKAFAEYLENEKENIAHNHFNWYESYQ